MWNKTQIYITKSVLKHNEFAESIFAYMDCLMKERINVSLLTCEALIMFAKNKTAEWLAEKGDKETAADLAHARKSREQVTQKFSRRQRESKEFTDFKKTARGRT